MRRSSATAPGLSLDTSAVISVMPAARASATNSAPSERDLCGVAVANEAGDRDRLLVTLDVCDECMTGPVDQRELPEL